MANALATLFLDIRARSARLATDFNKARSHIRKFGKDVSKVGRIFSVGFSLPIAAAAGLAIREFAKVEQAFAGVRKTVNASPKEFIALEKSIIDMSKKLPFASAEIAKVAQFSGQLGVQIGDLKNFTRTMLDMGVAFDDMSAEEAAKGVAKLKISMGESLGNVRELGNVITALGNNMGAFESEILTTTTYLAPAAKAFGLTSEHAAALAAALVEAGINAQAGGSAMSLMFLEMQKASQAGGDALKDFAAVSQIPLKEFAKIIKEEPIRAVEGFINGLTRMKEAGGKSIIALENLGLNSRRVMNAMNALSGGAMGVSFALDILADAQKGGGALANEAARFYATLGNALKVAKNNVAELGRVIGAHLAKSVYVAIDATKGLTDWFLDLNAETQKVLVAMTAVAAIAPVVALALGSVAIAAAVIGTTMGAVILTFGLVTIAAMAVAAAIIAGWDKIHRTFIRFKAQLEELRRRIQMVALKIAIAWNEATQQMANDFAKFLNNLFRGLERYSRKLSNVFKLLPGGTHVGKAFGELANSLAGANIQVGSLEKNTRRLKTALSILEAENPFQKMRENLRKAWQEAQKSDNVIQAFVISAKRGFGILDKAVDSSIDQLNEVDEAAEAVKDTFKDLNKQLKDLNKGAEENKLKKAMEDAATAGNSAAFKNLQDDLTELFYNATSDGIEGGLKDQKNIDAARKLAIRQAELAADAAREAGIKAAEAIADKQTELNKKSHEKTVKFWRSLMENAIEGTQLNFEDVAKGFAVDFASEFLSAFGDINIESLGSSMGQEFGNAAAKTIGGALFGESGAGGKGVIGSVLNAVMGALFGSGSTATGAGGGVEAIGQNADGSYIYSDGGTAGQQVGTGIGAVGSIAGMAGMGGWITAAIAVAAIAAKGAVDETSRLYANFKSGSFRDDDAADLLNWTQGLVSGNFFQHLSNAINEGIGAGDSDLFNFAFNPENQIMDWLGLTDKIAKSINDLGDIGAQTRRAIEGWLEDSLQSAIDSGQGMIYQDKRGDWRNNFGPDQIAFGDRDRFANGQWATDFNQTENVHAFTALGEALEELLGITEDVGGQIGYLLSQNLGDNLDNARMLVQTLGISIEEMEGALLDAAMAGETTWHEWAVMMQGVRDLAGEGLEAVGNIEGAFQQLIQSGGRGAQALIGIHNIAIEAMESEAVNSIQDLEAWLLSNTDFTTDQVAAFMLALTSNGITSLEELAEASDSTMGQIAADMDTYFQEAGQDWSDWSTAIKAADEDLKEVEKRLKSIQDMDDIDVTIRVHVVGDDIPDPDGKKTGKAMGTGLFSGLDLGGASMLPRLPATTAAAAASRSSSSGDMTINVDARGAAPGSENAIRNALLQVKDMAVAEAVTLMQDMTRR